MKPAGGTYKPNKMNIGKIPNKAAGLNKAAGVNNSGSGEGEGAEPGDPGVAASASVRHTGPTTAKVMSASPLELILMMYEQFFELIPDIKKNIERKSAAAAEPDSERAHAIVEELIESLDFNVELSKDIGAIYFYVRNKIHEANIRFDAAIWDHIESIMRPLYDGFKTAYDQLDPSLKQPLPSAGNPSIIAGMTYGQDNLKEIVINTKSGLKV